MAVVTVSVWSWPLWFAPSLAVTSVVSESPSMPVPLPVTVSVTEESVAPGATDTELADRLEGMLKLAASPLSLAARENVESPHPLPVSLFVRLRV